MFGQSRFLIGQFRPGEGLLYRLDARTKILMVMLVMVLALVSTNLLLYGVLIVILSALLLACRLGWRTLLNNLKPVMWFIAFTALFHLLLSGHDDPNVAFRLPFITVSDKAATMAGVYSARILVFVLSTFVMSLTTNPVTLTEAIVTLLKPLRWLKVPIYDLGMILFIALRFIPVLAIEMETIRKAQYIRGVDFGGSLRSRVKRSVALVLPVFFSALRRADELSVAIETRGYRSGRPRSSLRPLRFRPVDHIIMALGGVAVIGFIMGSRYFR